MLYKVKEYAKEPEGLAIWATFLFGFVVHLFSITNIIHNYDDVAVAIQGYGTGLTSGRWALSLLGDFFLNHFGLWNVSYLNSLAFLLLVALSASCVVRTFRINNKMPAILTGMLLICFPTATSTLFFKYTVAFYGLAIFLSVVTVYFADRGKMGWIILSGLCTAVSLGIYQAYLPVTISLMILLLLVCILRDTPPLRFILKKALHYAFSLVTGLIFYYLFLKISLKRNQTELAGYQGIDQMGSFSLSSFPGLLIRSYKCFLSLAYTDVYQLSPTHLVNLIYDILGLLCITVIIIILIKKKPRVSLIICVLLLCLIFPIGVAFIHIMCPNSYIYTMMVYSFVAVPLAPIVLVEVMLTMVQTWRKKVQNIFSKTTIVALLLLIGIYSYYDNVNYTAMYYSTEQMENYMNSVVTQVKMTEGFDTSKKWVFVGKVNDPLLYNKWQEAPLYGGNEPYLQTTYSRDCWIGYYDGYAVPLIVGDEANAIAEQDEVKAMPCYPNYGSVKVIDDMVIVKFSEPQ